MKINQITLKRNATFQDIFEGLESLRKNRSTEGKKPMPTLENLYAATYNILYCNQTGRFNWQGDKVVKEYKGNKAYILIKRVADYIKKGKPAKKMAWVVITSEGNIKFPAE